MFLVILKIHANEVLWFHVGMKETEGSGPVQSLLFRHPRCSCMYLGLEDWIGAG